MSDLATARSSAGSIEGWFTDPEGELIYNVARSLTGRGVVVEIGSWKGKSTVYLASGARAGAGAQVVAIDPHTGAPEHEELFGKGVWTFDEFQANIARAGLQDQVRPIVATSEAAAAGWNEPIELLFIDGIHDYEMVKLDFELWSPHIVPGGYVAFHDTSVAIYPGVKRIVKEAIFGSRDFRRARFADSLLVAQKVETTTAAERLQLQCAHILRYPDDFARRLRWGFLPKPLRALGLSVLRRMQQQEPQP